MAWGWHLSLTPISSWVYRRSWRPHPSLLFLSPFCSLFLFVSLSSYLFVSVSLSVTLTLLNCCFSLQGFKHPHPLLCDTCRAPSFSSSASLFSLPCYMLFSLTSPTLPALHIPSLIPCLSVYLSFCSGKIKEAQAPGTLAEVQRKGLSPLFPSPGGIRVLS